MPQVMTSTVVAAPAPQVWALLRDFAAIGSWHPYLTECVIEDGPPDRVGCTRVFPTYAGHRETLTSLDDGTRSIGYAFLDSAGLPVRDYRCLLRVHPVTQPGGSALVQWQSQFDCDAGDEENAVTQIHDFLAAGLDALAEHFATAEPAPG